MQRNGFLLCQYLNQRRDRSIGEPRVDIGAVLRREQRDISRYQQLRRGFLVVIGVQHEAVGVAADVIRRQRQQRVGKLGGFSKFAAPGPGATGNTQDSVYCLHYFFSKVD